MFWSLPRPLIVSVLALALAACASVTDTPNQQVQVLTPGADGAKCTLESDYASLVAYPPQRVFIRRMQEPLKVTCMAPGNRERTQMVYPSLNPAAAPNALTAGLGGIYDHFSGALYEYPSPIVVDFSHTVATERALPAYHAPDTISPFDINGEDMRDQPTLHPDEYPMAPLPPAPFRVPDSDEDMDPMDEDEPESDKTDKPVK